MGRVPDGQVPGPAPVLFCGPSGVPLPHPDPLLTSPRQVSPYHHDEDKALSCGPSSSGETEPDSSKDEEVRPWPGQGAAREAGDERGWGACLCVCGPQPEGGL